MKAISETVNSKALAERIERRRRYLREWYRRDPERTKATCLRWKLRNPEKEAARSRAWAGRNPEKRAAHHALGYALHCGRITKGSCEMCGVTQGVHAHHDDYSKPLEVRWLCARHHALIHHKNLADAMEDVIAAAATKAGAADAITDELVSEAPR